MSKAYVETTIITDLLLKPGEKRCAEAAAALGRFATTLLPVYAIKEWKAGPLTAYAYVHDKLLQTRSMAATVSAVHSLYYMPKKKDTCLEAITAAAHLSSSKSASDFSDKDFDEEVADRYRYALASLVKRTWKRRRRVTSETIRDLECYVEAEPEFHRDGTFNLKPRSCSGDVECCLASELKERPDLLEKLRNAIPETSTRKEDRMRRQVLKQLIHHPKERLTREQCVYLGDAVFAFFAPADATILTTNIRDHKPLAESIGKRVEAP